MAERTPHGDPIHSYDDGPLPDADELAPGDDELIEGLGRHLAETFGEIDVPVLHEIISPTVHLDVHIVPPTEKLPYYLLITTGLASRPMSPPAEVVASAAPGEDFRHAELMMLLPQDWPLFQPGQPYGPDPVEGVLPTDEQFWPIKWLKMLARFPHEYGAWIWHGHSVPSGDPLPGTKFTGSVFVDGSILEDELGETFDRFQAGDRSVKLLLVVPVYEEEMELKMNKGMDALLIRWFEQQIPLEVRPDRPNAAA
jgi:hypothetical protein